MSRKLDAEFLRRMAEAYAKTDKHAPLMGTMPKHLLGCPTCGSRRMTKQLKAWLKQFRGTNDESGATDAWNSR